MVEPDTGIILNTVSVLGGLLTAVLGYFAFLRDRKSEKRSEDAAIFDRLKEYIAILQERVAASESRVSASEMKAHALDLLVAQLTDQVRAMQDRCDLLAKEHAACQEQFARLQKQLGEKF